VNALVLITKYTYLGVVGLDDAVLGGAARPQLPLAGRRAQLRPELPQRKRRRISANPGPQLINIRPGRTCRSARTAQATPSNPAPNGCLIEAPWLINGGHGASLRGLNERGAAQADTESLMKRTAHTVNPSVAGFQSTRGGQLPQRAGHALLHDKNRISD
jgi:hypothetical protein